MAPNEPINLSVTLAQHPGGSSVTLNDLDISGIVSSIIITGAVHSLPKVTIELIPERIKVLLPQLQDILFLPPLDVNPNSDPSTESDHPSDVPPKPRA